MAQVAFSEQYAEVWGALDSVKDGQRNRRRLISRRHNYTTRDNFDDNGNKLHELFYYHFHEGSWSDGATRNRKLIKAAQRTAHDIEHICYHPEQYNDPALIAMAQFWQQRYADYRATFPPDSKDYMHFYNWMYSEIYQTMRREAAAV